jgi:signal transduction histidine kinase
MHELESSQAQLIQVEKSSAIGTMVAGVAHELNNPLTSMLQFVQYLQRRHPEEGRTASVLEDLALETERCIGIVDDLLVFSRSSSGEKFESEYVEVSLPDLLERVEGLLAYRFRETGARMSTRVSSEVPPVQARGEQITQVLLNLLSNALDVLEGVSDPEIVVTMEAGDGRLAVSVADNGGGISTSDRERVFDPFFTTKPVGKGTGLGLSVSRGIVEAQGGTLTWENRPDGGTVFCMSLPLDEAQGESSHDATCAGSG